MDLLRQLESYSSHDGAALVAAYSDCEFSLSYRKLWEKSTHLAQYIAQTLPSDKRPIIVYGHKHPYMLVAFLAAVRSGHPYCPLDTNLPMKRVKDIIEMVDPPLVFAVEALDMTSLNIDARCRVILDRTDISKIAGDADEEKNKIKNADDLPLPEMKAEDIFYILFTSGSTGLPKGVQVSYGNLNAFLRWSCRFFDRQHGLRFLNQAPFSFDLSVMELYSSLYTRGTIYALSQDVQASYPLLMRRLKNSDLEFWVSTPSFANLCLADKSFTADLLPKLRTFWFCGETLPHKTASDLRRRFPQARVFNTYGPTESTVAVTSILIDDEVLEKWNPLPIGRPKDGTEILIGEEEAVPEKDLSSGEIVIAGDTVADGYFQNPAQTGRAFSRIQTSQGCLPSYRTGDKGYWQDGLLFYQGRMDLQLKLHGYRIEIEDIENNMRSLSSVSQVAVLPNYAADQTVRSLSAYIVYAGQIDNRFQAMRQIKAELAERVPAYMIPKNIIFIEALPTTANGKIDRRALQELSK